MGGGVVICSELGILEQVEHLYVVQMPLFNELLLAK